MILVDHKLKTNAIKTQHTYRQSNRAEATKRVKLCHNSNQYAREKETKKATKKTFIYIVFSLKCRRRRSERERFQFAVLAKKEMQRRLAAFSTQFKHGQLSTWLWFWLDLAWVFFFGDWGLRFGFWVLVSVRLWLFNCLCLASIFGGSSASFGAVTNSARRSWPRVLNA